MATPCDRIHPGRRFYFGLSDEIGLSSIGKVKGMTNLESVTVRLERTNGLLHRSYYFPDYGHLSKYDHVCTWSQFATDFAFDGQRGLDALASLLDRGGEEALEKHLMGKKLVTVGEALFEVLFGGSAEWTPLLRAAFKVQPDDADPSPTFQGLRVRIWAEDPVLANLPWRSTAWQGRWLMNALPGGTPGWIFETVVGDRPRRPVNLPGPCKILVVAPQCIEAETDQHLDELRRTLEDISEQYKDETHLRIVEGRGDLETALRGMRPHVVYYYGHGGSVNEQPCLLLGGVGESPVPLPMQDLRILLEGHPPLAVFLNACKLGAGGWQCAGRQLLPPVRFVCANRTTAFSRYSTQMACHFFQRFLGEGRDPVVSLHALPGTVSTTDFQWATATVWSDYPQWVTRLEQGKRLHRKPGQRLDRDSQRALARKHVDELTASPNRRVEAFVTYGSEGALVHRFGDQLHDYLHKNKIRIKWKNRDPEDADPVVFEPIHLEEDLRIWLGDPEAPLQHIFNLQVPSRDNVHVLALNWGTYGGENRQGVPTWDELGDWLAFCADLANHCPDDLRLVCHLSLEISVDEHSTYEEKIEDLADRLDHDQFRCTLLPVLDDVKRRDIRNYLADRSNTNCPPSLVPDVSRLIFDKTKGRYEETVALIEEGEDGWSRLHHKLQRGSS